MPHRILAGAIGAAAICTATADIKPVQFTAPVEAALPKQFFNEVPREIPIEEDGMAAPRLQVVRGRPKLLTGTLTIAGKQFAYASGGHGWSIPYGDHKITPDEVGSWGKRHGAIGLDGDEIPDPQLGRTREGIEIHSARHMASAGCVVVPEFDALKHAVFAMIESAGHAWLHVGPTGAAITPTRASPLPPFVYIAERVVEDEPRRTKHRRHHHHRRMASR